ncbi:MAG: heparinase, partial [Calditrichaeota bacterium]|nr:heparinase [Calditrichota bacterium]
MKKYLVAFWLIFLASSVYSQTFLSQISLAQIDSALTAAGPWRPAPTIENRRAFEKIPSPVAEKIVAEAEEVKDYDWPILMATLYLDYARTGTRTNYKKLYKQRRENLCKLVLAECIRNDGKYLDQIANGIWAICEETSWVVPAHVAYFHDPVGLPNIEERHVDLFAAETGATLSMIKYLLGEKLDSVSPLIRKRIQKEVKERILEPNLQHTDFRWMGYDKTGRRPNNWNPWICSNWLQCILLSDDSTSYKAKQIHKLMEVLNNFVAPYPQDGGCDEGANYWRRAAGSLFDVNDMLHSATAGKISFYNQPLIKKMGQYLYKMWIDGNYFVNFADCHPELTPEPTLLYCFGKKIKDPNLVALAVHFAKTEKFSLS